MMMSSTSCFKAKAIITGRLLLRSNNVNLRRSMVQLAPKEGLPTIQPGVKSDKAPYTPAGDGETMMPWEGYFSSFLKSSLGSDRYEKLRKLVLWTTDDIHNLEGIPKPSTRVPISKDGTLTAQYRYPSPGNRKPVQIPEGDADNDPYNIAYYVRDTGRRGGDPAFPFPEVEKAKAMILPGDDPRVQELKEKLAAGPGSSPGNKGVFATGKSDYDPTGLRASMSTSWAALNESLDKYEPNHLPTPNWVDRQDEIIAKWEARGVPCPPGEYQFGKVPVQRRIARWGSAFGGDIHAEKV